VTLAWLQGCTSLKPTQTSSLTTEQFAQVTSVGPFPVIADAPSGSTALGTCMATHVEGRVKDATPDTVTFSRISRIIPATKFDPACRITGAATIPLGATETSPLILAKRFSGVKTAAAVVGVSLILFVAMVSAIDTDLGLGSSYP
jgi:hypothetical protein